jgi:NAD(P)-dependent dehydrogenase (short-subunit alcohol dehydrogenase family)
MGETLSRRAYDDGKLANKVALVTGGSAGIGLGFAKQFAAEGARMFITGRRPAELDKVISAISGNGASGRCVKPSRSRSHLRADRGSSRTHRRTGGECRDEFGALGAITEKHFDKTFSTNVRGLLYSWTPPPGLSPQWAQNDLALFASNVIQAFR